MLSGHEHLARFSLYVVLFAVAGRLLSWWCEARDGRGGGKGGRSAMLASRQSRLSSHGLLLQGHTQCSANTPCTFPRGALLTLCAPCAAQACWPTPTVCYCLLLSVTMCGAGLLADGAADDELDGHSACAPQLGLGVPSDGVARCVGGHSLSHIK